MHTGFLPALGDESSVKVWPTSASNARLRKMWEQVPTQVESFPQIRPFKEFPYNFIRRLNDYTWDFHLRDPSRMSMMRHIRNGEQQWYIRALKPPARVLAAIGLQTTLEEGLEHLMTRYDRSQEALSRLKADRPDLIVSTGSFRYEEPAIIGVAKKLRIPVLAFITSWDNISIKNRMVFKYDGYLVWSERMNEELRAYYPHCRKIPVYVVGAPQYDVFFDSSWYVSREEFCARYGLRADHPVIVHALGVANGVEELPGALDLAKRIQHGELGDAQLVVRPHPFNNGTEMNGIFRKFGPRVVVQKTAVPEEARTLRSQDEADIREWVNTFRHADVVVHLSSTVAIDAALFDRPSVCMDYDPMPGRLRQALVRDVNHSWTHYKPVVDSGGMLLASSPDELIDHIRQYLSNPGLHREERRKMAEFVCGYLDGRCGERMAGAVLDFVKNHVPGQSQNGN